MPHEQTHYQVLGIKPGAKHTDIGIAYQRIMGRRRAEHAPPDPAGDDRIQEAYDVLSDPEAREYYDADLRAAALKRPLPLGTIAAVVAALAGAGFAAWHFLRAEPSLQAEAVAPEKIAQSAAPAVGRIERLQVSGASRADGVAFSIAEGLMVTSCAGMAPGTQLIVTLLGRRVPASVRSHDSASGLCQLDAPDTGSWPLAFTGHAPRVGDRVFSAHVDAKGAVALRDGKVTKVTTTGAVTTLETSFATVGGIGAPLFDAQARVVAVSSLAADGREIQVRPPEAWIGTVAPRAKPIRPAEETPPAAEAPASKDELKLAPRGNPLLSADPEEVKRRGAETYKPRIPDDI
jgi:hypothetical protein